MDAENFIEPEAPNPADNAGPADFKMPSVEELLEALEGMEGLTDESKEELRQSLLSGANQATPSQAKGTDMLVLFVLLFVILFIFVFFGYKLYKSLADRERRKEEKRRQKQQKKKK